MTGSSPLQVSRRDFTKKVRRESLGVNTCLHPPVEILSEGPGVDGNEALAEVCYFILNFPPPDVRPPG